MRSTQPGSPEVSGNHFIGGVEMSVLRPQAAVRKAGSLLGCVAGKAIIGSRQMPTTQLLPFVSSVTSLEITRNPPTSKRRKKSRRRRLPRRRQLKSKEGITDNNCLFGVARNH